MEDTPETPPPSEGFSFTQICELLGFNPAQTASLTVTADRVIAVSTTFIEPPEGETHGE